MIRSYDLISLALVILMLFGCSKESTDHSCCIPNKDGESSFLFFERGFNDTEVSIVSNGTHTVFIATTDESTELARELEINRDTLAFIEIRVADQSFRFCPTEFVRINYLDNQLSIEPLREAPNYLE